MTRGKTPASLTWVKYQHRIFCYLKIDHRWPVGRGDRRTTGEIMSKTTIAILCLCLLATPLAESNAQQQVAVQIKNRGTQSIYIGVYDHVCRNLVYRGQLPTLSSASVRVCLDQRGRGNLTVTDQLRRDQTFEVSTRRRSVNVRFRRQGR